jgi:diacylglycerol kinase family enzyme
LNRTATVLVNPAAGADRREDVTTALREIITAAGITARVVPLTAPAQIPAAVRDAIASGTDVIAAAGGDGTVSTVAAAMLGMETALAVLPLGTLNHFAKDLGIPLDLAEAVRAIAAGRIVAVDVGEVNGRSFLNNSSIGVYPDIVVARDGLRQEGRGKWAATLIASARILIRYRGLTVRVTTKDNTRAVRTPFVFVGNNQYQVEGLRFGRRMRLDAGELVAYLAPCVHARDLPFLAALALLGRKTVKPVLESFPAGSLIVETPGRRRLRVALDGEVTQMMPPLKYRVRPKALNVVVPAPSGEVVHDHDTPAR